MAMNELALIRKLPWLQRQLFAAEEMERVMQQAVAMEERIESASRQVGAVETLATIEGRRESVAAVAHDARNMVTALGLYCDLLEEPGVLAGAFRHYGSELRLISEASRSLVEKFVALNAAGDACAKSAGSARGARWDAGLFTAGEEIDHENQARSSRYWEPTGGAPMTNLAAELLANHNLLAALAGPSITVTVDVEGGARPVRMTGEDLTRVLVNLVKNATEAMGPSGRIQIELRELAGEAGEPLALALSMEDSGPGISDGHLDAIFTAGYTTRGSGRGSGHGAGRGAGHGSGKRGDETLGALRRGQGLAIVRSIVDAAEGLVFAANRPPGGARFEIRLPVRRPESLSAPSRSRKGWG